ncbi:hypothetical protein LPY66_02055 [Dehalobacter sp. DCM]|uniref:uroporphyrinogen decarboxylase family protein n=1 Tax=Dehalobacter sp. DCM TaxID=2907827 RepID=UPI0030820420|nr:hypothetical protein LPY66_02055 [Dehalobacter sp. DCM]
MLSPRENYLIAARGGKPEYVPSFIEDSVVFHPPFWLDSNPDFFNIKWVENEYGRMPSEDWRAMTDISQWRETAKFPDLSKMDWEAMIKDKVPNIPEDKVKISMVNTEGIFLIPANMLGWVDALCTIHEEPEQLIEFIEAITDFLVEEIKYEQKYFKPDIMFFGDDVASTTGPFISKKTWDEMYKPYFKRMCDAIHESGALAEFHCCGNTGYLIEEFLNIGVDICQLPEPNDELMAMKKRYGNRLVITGGWDRHGAGSKPGASEDVVRQSVRTAIDDYGKDGALIFWDGGIIGNSEDAKQKMKWVMDELHNYGRQIYR